jgi:chemotaxis protein CheD
MKLHSAQKNTTSFSATPPCAETTDAGSASPHFLHAGQIFVSGEAASIALILGSCVGVCIWDSQNAIGGATHFMLPSWDGKGVQSPRYGNVAISMLLKKLLDAGANRAQLRAKVFGGGCLFDSLREPSGHKEQHLGSRNVEMALDLLGKAQIQIVLSEVGLHRGQRVVFRTDTGATVSKSL